MSDRSMSFREVVKYRAGALCLIGILAATFMHSTTFMSQFFYHSIILGAVAAFAIDAGVVAMSIFKDELLKDGELAWMVRVVTSLVLFASGVANMAEGFKSAYGITLTYENLVALDWLTWTQWLAGTVIFPVLAYVMCDTIGTRNLVELRKQESGNDRERIKYVEKPGASFKETGDAARKEKAANRRFALLKVIKDNPNSTIRELQSILNEEYPEHAVDSHSTIDNDLRMLKQQGLLAGNGKVESLV